MFGLISVRTYMFIHAVYLVDLWNTIEAFREYGLNALDWNSSIGMREAESICVSLFLQLNKRLAAFQQIDADLSASIVVGLLQAMFDR